MQIRAFEEGGTDDVVALNLQVREDNSDALGFYAVIGYGVDDAVSLGKRLIAD